MTLTHLSIPLSDGGSSPRPSGVHLSGILLRMAIAQGIYSSDSPLSFDARKFKRIVGLAWEDWLAPRLLSHFPTFEYHFGTLCVNDIHMTPDGVHFSPDGRIVLHEIKASYYSSKQLLNPEAKLIVWLWQCMGYLYGLSDLCGSHCTTAILHPLFLCGDYSTDRTPHYRPIHLSFTWEEITTLWSLVLQYRDTTEPEKYSDAAPPPPPPPLTEATPFTE